MGFFSSGFFPSAFFPPTTTPTRSRSLSLLARVAPVPEPLARARVPHAAVAAISHLTLAPPRHPSPRPDPSSLPRTTSLHQRRRRPPASPSSSPSFPHSIPPSTRPRPRPSDSIVHLDRSRPEEGIGAPRMKISFEAWEGVQRHGQDNADRLAEGFTGLLQAAPPQFPWPPVSHKLVPFEIDLPVVPFGTARRGPGGKDFFPTAAVAFVIDIGGRLGQAGVEIGTSVGGAVQHVVRQLPVPFRGAQIRRRKLHPPPSADGAVGLSAERAADRCPLETAAAATAAATGSAAASTVGGVRGGDDLDEDDDGYGCEIGTLGNFKKAKGTVNMSATYNTRNNDIESSVVARGDLWRLEASRSGSTSGNDSSLFTLFNWGLYYLFVTLHSYCLFICQSNICCGMAMIASYLVETEEMADDVDDVS